MFELGLRFISTLAALISVMCAVYVAWRAGMWRNSDTSKELQARIGTLESRLGGVELRLSDVPTRADFERVSSDVRAMTRELNKIDDSVVRIEGWLMGRPK
ncbi:MAG: DUF2730 family protein [Sphingomonadaceae bacterium]